MIQKHALLLVGVLSTKMHAGLSNYYLWLLVHQYQNSNLQHMLKDWSSKNAFRRRQKKLTLEKITTPGSMAKLGIGSTLMPADQTDLFPCSADFLHRSSDISFKISSNFGAKNQITTQVLGKLNRDTTLLMNLSDQA